MANTVKRNNKIYTPGRAGELTETANKQTFELLEKIFAHGGPYRRVLHEFGIGNKRYKGSFLKLIDKKVLADIEAENNALWKSCMHKIIYDGKNVSTKLNLTPLGIIKGLGGFVKKTLKEAMIISKPKKYLAIADKKYNDYCKTVDKAFKNKRISQEEFFTAYENVVYVTYLFELFYKVNLNDNFSNSELREYVRKNDYLLKYDESYAEFTYKPKNGFSLGEKIDKGRLKNLGTKKPKLIPNKIPNCKANVDIKYAAEKKLQCLKNNMRLKTNTLLYFLTLNENDSKLK